MPLKKKTVLAFFKEYLLITLGIAMYVLGWTIFLVPNNLVGGGVTGISSILQYATGGLIKMGYTYFSVNIILLVIALFTLGKGFGVKSVYALPSGSTCSRPRFRRTSSRPWPSPTAS